MIPAKGEKCMKYICLIYSDERLAETATQEEATEWMGAYYAFTSAVQNAGVLVEGEALDATSKATTVRVRNGKILTTDGPFAETKEQLGGYYLLDCKDEAEALAWAARIPGATVGSIEVRPLMEFN
jgi:hypothetical protein